MTDYNDGKWHPWDGGECPVHPESEIEVLFKDGTVPLGKAGTAYWSEFGVATIVAFRVTKEHKEPREFWVWNDTLYENFKVCRYQADMFGGDVIHVREVLE